MKIEIPVIERNGTFILQKTFEGHGQKQVRLGKNKKVALNRARAFLDTAEKNGFETAMEELTGKPVLKKGDDLTAEQIVALYEKYCAKSPNPPRPITIKANTNRLKYIMKQSGAETLSAINTENLSVIWYGDSAPTPKQKRTFASAIAAASGVFKKAALAYYKKQGHELKNPFIGVDAVKPKVGKFVPTSQNLRETLWNDCQTELKPAEAMICLLAMGAGLRRAEIEAAIPEWFSEQSDCVYMHVREEPHFQPKAGEDGMVPIPKELYHLLLKLRGDSKSMYFVPTDSEHTGGVRIRPQTQRLNKWLQGKGFTQSRPLHALRKECGSLVAKNQGILEASKILRNTPQVCAIHYAGVAETKVVNMAGSFDKAATPEETLAKKMGITLEELNAKLS